MRSSLAAVLICIALVRIEAGGSTRSQDASPPFAEWLAGVRAEAVARGIREDIVDAALSDVQEPLPVILERDRAQAEKILTLDSYVAQHVKPSVVRTARTMFEKHQPLLESIAERYGVPAHIVLAVWGMESNFGRFSGVRPTIAALATLAWDPRRATFFRGELFKALEIANRGDIELSRMRGSWAGAMGQPQFLPSSYLDFAEDFDGDGRRDIWSSPADVFASIANYLKGHGWHEGRGWGREVKLSSGAPARIAAAVGRREGTCTATRDMTVSLPPARWRELGVTLAAGRPLPQSMPDAALVTGKSRSFLVYENYDALLAYNCAHAYAISVALLADRAASPIQPSATPSNSRSRKR